MNRSILKKSIAVLFAGSAISAQGATTLIDEDFNNPLDGAVNGTSLLGNSTNFPGWNFNDGSGLTPGYRVGPQDGVPVSAGDGHIKMDSFGTVSDPLTVQYDTGHAWSATDVFTLTINATEQEWNNATGRFMILSIKETARTGNNITGATLWTATEELVYDVNHNTAAEGWGPNSTFSFTFNAADFVTGTAGTAISFEIAGSGSRGYHFDNVFLSVVPEPSTALLGGLGMLALLRRRR